MASQIPENNSNAHFAFTPGSQFWPPNLPVWFVQKQCLTIMWSMFSAESLNLGVTPFFKECSDAVDRITAGTQEAGVDLLVNLARALNPGASNDLLMGFLSGIAQTVAVLHFNPLIPSKEFLLEHPETTVEMMNRNLKKEYMMVRYLPSH